MKDVLNTPENKAFIIAVSGDPVSGKSSTIRALIKKYEKDGYKTDKDNVSSSDKVIIKVSAGQLFREVAKEADISIGELTELAKGPSTMADLKKLAVKKDFFERLSEEELSKRIDFFIDEYTLRFIDEKQKNYPRSLIIADSRIAGLFMKRDNKPAFKIRFSIQHEIAAKRLIKDSENRKEEIEKVVSFEEAVEMVKERRETERDRFYQIYGLDLYDMNNYDLVVNTSGISKDKIVELLYTLIDKAQKGEKTDKFYRSTKYIYPGRPINEKNENSEKLTVIKSNGEYYALNGQNVVGQYNRKGYKNEIEHSDEIELKENEYGLLPYILLAEGNEVLKDAEGRDLYKGMTANEYVKRFVKSKDIKKFQERYNFKYEEQSKSDRRRYSSKSR